MDGAVVIAQAKPQDGNDPRLNERTVDARTSAAGILTLTRPQAGAVSTFDARGYSLIDFMLIHNQWAALVQVGRTLRIVFSDGSVIKLLNFFSYGFTGDASNGDTANDDGIVDGDTIDLSALPSIAPPKSVPRNSALASAIAEFRLRNGLSLIAKFDGGFSDRPQTYAGAGHRAIHLVEPLATCDGSVRRRCARRSNRHRLRRAAPDPRYSWCLARPTRLGLVSIASGLRSDAALRQIDHPHDHRAMGIEG